MQSAYVVGGITRLVVTEGYNMHAQIETEWLLFQRINAADRNFPDT